ncbi:MAG: hypothetical protein DRO93_10140 [Candidatus Thorarchaeota archaeon]|nr:MAG: hypothetical protein DRO93_10140 [Candidatus Thorarchaeota archaeon]
MRGIRIERTIATIDDLHSVLVRNHASVLIVVGHGTPDGLAEGSGFLAWSSLVAEIGRTETRLPAILSCYSSTIQEYLRSAVGFDGEIDATLGAIALGALVVSLFNGKASDMSTCSV